MIAGIAMHEGLQRDLERILRISLEGFMFEKLQ